MQSTTKTNIEAHIASLLSWWQMAGADYAVSDQSCDWLEAPPAKQPTPAPATKPVIAASSFIGAGFDSINPQFGVAPQFESLAWPNDLVELQRMIADGAAFPGNCFGGQSAAPVGKTLAKLMIISDVPDIDDIAAQTLGAGFSGKLLTQMIAAIGIDITDCYLASLGSTRPATGELPDAIGDIVPFMHHHISLVDPTAVIILGSAATKALLGEELMDARGSLRFFNHDVRKKAVLTTFHPRTLLAQPMLKAQAWKDLQMLTKKGVL